MRMTVPLNSSLFNDSQSGTARLVETSNPLVASWRDTLLFLTAITSFTFRAYDGMLTFRPFTVTWPWLTLWRAAAQGFFIDAAELAFHQAVVIPEFLLFDQTEAVIGVLAAGFRAVNARTIIAALQ